MCKRIVAVTSARFFRLHRRRGLSARAPTRGFCRRPLALIAAAHVGLSVKLSKYRRDEKAREIKNGGKLPSTLFYTIVMESIVFRPSRAARTAGPRLLRLVAIVLKSRIRKSPGYTLQSCERDTRSFSRKSTGGRCPSSEARPARSTRSPIRIVLRERRTAPLSRSS